jgi:Fe-S cluster biosynthesis and repair protein YggX
MRIIHCQKLNKEAEGFEQAPYPGALGERVYQHISKEAWQLWLTHQTMLINEYRLSMLDPKARQFLTVEMEKFLFGTGSEKPAGFVPPGK